MAADRQAARRSRTTGKKPPQSGQLRGLPGYLADDGPPDLDRLVHERVRLGILSALAVNESLTFTQLRELLKTTDGNLSVHARKLEDAGYLKCHKSFEDRVPRTEYAITPRGQESLERYLDHMEALIRAMRKS